MNFENEEGAISFGLELQNSVKKQKILSYLSQLSSPGLKLYKILSEVFLRQ